MSRTLLNRIGKLEAAATPDASPQEIFQVDFIDGEISRAGKAELARAKTAEARGENPLIVNLKNWSPAGWRRHCADRQGA